MYRKRLGPLVEMGVLPRKTTIYLSKCSRSGVGGRTLLRPPVPFYSAVACTRPLDWRLGLCQCEGVWGRNDYCGGESIWHHKRKPWSKPERRWLFLVVLGIIIPGFLNGGAKWDGEILFAPLGNYGKPLVGICVEESDSRISERCEMDVRPDSEF